ncbi:hypothetical protein [Actinomadura sp. NEAU-AAG7]|uniref:hypothetical protein n=1 Tax=Actinomadura sp. NEAU-AAG7 TaxID=2839640 RepID=UPI001BE45929|nr:hypothetical protein [Actinomadura sp. NEAU-AAG7]
MITARSPRETRSKAVRSGRTRLAHRDVLQRRRVLQHVITGSAAVQQPGRARDAARGTGVSTNGTEAGHGRAVSRLGAPPMPGG